MKVALLGAAGTIGPAIARDLDESDEVESLRLLDADAGALARLEGETRVVDAGDEDDLASTLAGCDVLVNAASYRLNLTAMRTALRAHSHYIDLGGLYWMTGKQLARGDLTATGALPPERCVEPEHLFPELERRGCRFEIEQSEVVEA